ncbi:hypothetical protein CKM354_001262200 [Cercospora kikuchii]|uniref:RNase III domain-containing protein n=1 Tax=Cercospora kikuchii TaxID=84275 RepID=A0A9P3FMC6_9PEZI|nr:uncharacterized protein CKM354_001262200 [Cercospora kikuchii]GIZ49592.1 hypothetical protein CKM354_001262200 [Cercospora kikuchii]
MSQVRHSSVSAPATSSAKPSDIVLKSHILNHKALKEYEKRLPEHIAKLERLTGHRFNDPDCARAALWSFILEMDGKAVHAAQAQLAQIGDATLRALYFTHHFPNITPTLQQRFDIVASNAHLAQIFDTLQLQHLSVHINNSSVTWRKGTLVEAIIGAVFLDSGLNMTATDRAISAMRIFDIVSELSDEPQPNEPQPDEPRPHVTVRVKRRSRPRREREPAIRRTLPTTKPDAFDSASKPYAPGAQLDSNLLRSSSPKRRPESGPEKQISKHYKRSQGFLRLASARPDQALRGLGKYLNAVPELQNLIKKYSERKQRASPDSPEYEAAAMKVIAYEKLLQHKRRKNLVEAQLSDPHVPTNTYAQYHI